MDKFSIQLWSVRDECADDLEATLAKLSEYGYYGVEPFRTDYYGKTVEEFSACLKKYNLECPSFHCALEYYQSNGIEKTCDEMLKLGCRIVALPYLPWGFRPDEEHFDETKRYIEQIIKIYDKEGVKFLFHNHQGDAYPATENSTRSIMDVLFEDTGIMSEADTAWLICGGIKPSEFFKKHKGKIPAIHIKDFNYKTKIPKKICDVVGRQYVWEDEEPEEFIFQTLGRGIHDCGATIKQALEAGCEYIILEQDNATPGYTNLECAQMDAEYLRAIKL